jgi:hypothetical protein
MDGTLQAARDGRGTQGRGAPAGLVTVRAVRLPGSVTVSWAGRERPVHGYGGHIVRLPPKEQSPVPATRFDNIEILKAIDDRQQQNEGRKLWMSAHHLLNEMSGAFAADPRLMPGFLQELFTAQAAGQLAWRLMDRNASPVDANFYLQQIQDLALTTAGQDRARNRMIQLPPPDLRKMTDTT